MDPFKKMIYHNMAYQDAERYGKIVNCYMNKHRLIPIGQVSEK